MRVCFVSQMQNSFSLQENESIAYNRFLLVWTAENEHPQMVRMAIVSSTLEMCFKKLIAKSQIQQ